MPRGTGDETRGRRARVALAACLVSLLTACATPTRPTGGPDDTTPPTLSASVPEADDLRVTEREIVLTFSERINAQSGRAVTVVPEGETPPEIQVRGRELRITLDSLREATTYVVTVSTDLRDQRGVALREPITLAFSTGDELDRGLITGRLRSPARGEPVGGVAVWAYRADSTASVPDPRETAPDYSTQSGRDGDFALEYLREGTYYVVAVDDRNRNRRADPGERFAAPAQPVTEADSLGTNALMLTIASRDSIPPEPQRTRGLTDRRLAVRFSEIVTLQDRSPGAWALADSASGDALGLRAVYVDPSSPQEVRLEATEAVAPRPLRLALVRSGAVADSAGNAVAPFERVVTPGARPDTAAVRLAAFLPETRLPADSARTLRPDQRAGVRFSLPPDSARLGGVVVTSGGEPIPFTTRATTDGLGTEVEIDGEVRTFSLGVPVADSVQTRRYRRPSPSETGELAGRVTGADSPVIVEAVPASGEPFRTMTDSTGAFRLDGLPPGDYRLRFVVDADGNGAWSGGSLAPYVPPERISFGRDAQTVRARFETDVGEIALSD